MSEVSIHPALVEKTYMSFHAHEDAPRVVGLLREFGSWNKADMSPLEIARAKWWFKPDGRDELVNVLNMNGKLRTVGEVAKNFKTRMDEIKAVDTPFVEKIMSIRNFVARGGELPPIIMVAGRSPWAVPSMIEGYHRSLGVCVANLDGLIPGRKFEVYVGKKRFL